MLAACAPVGGTGWMVVVAEPMQNITKAGDEIVTVRASSACLRASSPFSLNVV